MFGPGSVDLFRSGDDAADREAAARVKALIAEKVAFEEIDANTQVALFGEKAWPFPIPLVKAGERWRFDTAAGRQELLNRRIGFNELATLSSLHAYVDAQFEYYAQGRDGNPPAFAQRVRSSEGKQDGLYWADRGRRGSESRWATCSPAPRRSNLRSRCPSRATSTGSSRARARTLPAASGATSTRRA